MAVILDMVLNHADDEFPYVKMYRDGGGPTPDNPFFNRSATHPYSVFNDFNHESTYTQALVDTINAYWLREYRFDGYRFDLSKGFTQRQSSGDAAFSARDDSRIAILKRMYDHLRTVDASAYVILEHFAENAEEKILSDYGMMLWANANHDYRNAVKGNTSNFTGVSYLARNFTAPHAIGYMESHDEERLMYDVLQNGRSAGSYNTQTLATALERMKLAAAFFFPVPGPKMIWQFGELGYDVSIDENGRVGNKPIRWEYQTDPNRRKLYQTYAELIKLKTTVPAFRSADFSFTNSGLTRKLQILDASMRIVILGNFDVTPANVNPGFPIGGKWYDYFTGNELNVTDPGASLLFQPGEFHIFTTQPLPSPAAGIVPWNTSFSNPTVTATEEALESQIVLYPNPAEHTVKISLENGYRGPVQLALYDRTGRSIHQTELQKKTATLSYECPVASWSAGLYLTEIRYGSQRVVRKWIKR
jgi:glycosidase